MTAFEMIPVPAKILAALAFVAAFAVPRWLFGSEILSVAVLAVILGAILAVYVLLTGYVYADASRRGMPPVAWALIVVLVPNCIGFVLYLLLRKPLTHPCPGCGNGVSPDAAFCPRCGQSQMGPVVHESSKAS
jgi:hypothetical protein